MTRRPQPILTPLTPAPGYTDRILDFSTAVTGSMFLVPTADFLDDPPALPVAASSAPRAPDGSLSIGSLKCRPS